MSLRDQVLAQAMLLAGDLSERQQIVLGALCTASTASLNARLREGLTAQDCKADFIAAASLFALAALSESDTGPREFTAGDLTVRKSDKNTAARCLRGQAELLMVPYVRDAFAFLGV